jgi:hypothetical protein
MLARGIVDADVLEAMRSAPRRRLVPAGARAYADADRPVPLAHGATVSRPYVVASMTRLACVAAGDRVLEVGTGSGYQAAVLAALGATTGGDLHATRAARPRPSTAPPYVTVFSAPIATPFARELRKDGASASPRATGRTRTVVRPAPPTSRRRPRRCGPPRRDPVAASRARRRSRHPPRPSGPHAGQA